MADYRLILSLIVQGYSYRQIEAMARCSHRAIAKAHTIAKDQSLTTTDQVDALTVDDLDRFFWSGEDQSTLVTRGPVRRLYQGSFCADRST